MNKIILLFVGIFLLGIIVSGKDLIKSDVYIKDLRAYELEGKIKLEWTVDHIAEVEGIRIEIKKDKKDIKIKDFGSSVRNYEFQSKAGQEYEIKVRIKNENGKYSIGKRVKAKSLKGLEIRNVDRYINTGMNSIKIYFDTNKGSKVKLYFSDKEKELKLKTIINYYSRGGSFDLGALQSGKKYYYKIVSEKNNEEVESEIISFVKDSFVEKRHRAKWAQEAIFYEIDIDKFEDSDGDGIGDIKGLTSRIKYFRDLDVDAIMLRSVLDSDEKLYIKSYYKIKKIYGTMNDFEEFINIAEKNGIKVIMDFEMEYGSSESDWFRKAVRDKNSNFRSYYISENAFERNYLEKENWYGDDFRYFSNVSEKAPLYDLKNPIFRSEIKKVAKFWMNKGIKGFRIGQARNDDEIYESFSKEFYSYLKINDEDFFVIGEKKKEIKLNLDMFYSFDSYYDYTMNKELIEKISKNEKGISDYFLEKRAEDVEARKIYSNAIFLTNRKCETFHSKIKDEDKFKLAVNIFFTMPGIPFLYFGDEKVKKKDFYEHYKKLIKIRKDNPCIFDGVYVKRKSIGELEVYDIYEDENREYKLQVVHNLGRKKVRFKIQAENYTKGEEILMGKTLKNFSFELNSYESIIIKYRR